MNLTIASGSALLAAALWVLRLGLFVALHVVRSDYSWVRHAVSDYAVGSTRRLASISTWVAAAAWSTESIAVWTGLPGWAGRASTTAGLLALTAIFTVLPWLPTDLEGTRATWIGRLHLVAAVAWFAIAYHLTGPLATVLAGGPETAALHGLHQVSAVSLIALIAALVLPKLRPIAFGITERIFLVAVTLIHLLAVVVLAVR